MKVAWRLGKAGPWVCSDGLWRCHLCEGKTSLVVHLEDLLDGVDVRRRPQVKAQVVLVSGAHDLLKAGEKTKSINSTMIFISVSLQVIIIFPLLHFLPTAIHHYCSIINAVIHFHRIIKHLYVYF